MNIKAEEVSDADEEVDPVPITFPEIKAEPEVSFMSVFAYITTPLCCLLDSEMLSL
jgi:hypothetical protein